MKLTILIPLGFLVWGCSSSPSTDATAGNGTPSPSPSTPTAPDRSQLSKELMNDAYHYYGLSNPKPVDYSMTYGSAKMPTTATGSVTATLTEIAADHAMFDVQYTGELEPVLGSMTLELRKDGIYVRETSLGKVKKDQLEMPGNLAPGSEWKSNSEVEKTGGTVLKQDTRYKVSGPVDVSTPVGKYKALLIKATGTISQGGSPGRITFEAYYVKDRGLVKQEITVVMQGQPASTVRIVEKKA